MNTTTVGAGATAGTAAAGAGATGGPTGGPTARTVPALLAWRVRLHPDRVAIEVAGVQTLTFARWDAQSRAVATALRRSGLRRGDRVGLRFGARDWTEFAVAYLGVQLAGGVAVPLSDRLAPAQLDYALRHCEAALVIHGSAAGPPEGSVPARTVAELVAAGHAPSDPSTGPALPTVRPGDLAQILYTSGTTGRPKGVGASHANLTLGAPNHPRRLPLAHSERFAHAFAIGTNAAQTMLLNALTARAAALTLPRFTPARFARLIADGGAGTVFVVPSMAIELLESGALRDRDLDGVQLIGSTAAALAPAVATRLAETFPRATIVNYYTSTEAAPAQTVMVYDPRRRDALGRAVQGQLRITDPAGVPLPVGEIGEVWLRSPHPRTYVGDDAATRTTFHGEWVRMGDVGRIDADGYLYLVDREQDVIKSGAFKISTLEVEAALLEHPAIAEAAVLAVPHTVLGAAVGAAVVPRPDADHDELATPALRAFLAARLADYQLPAQVLVRAELPRNEAGKVLKRELVADFQASAARDGNAQNRDRGTRS